MSQASARPGCPEAIHASREVRVPRCEIADTTRTEVWPDFDPTPAGGFGAFEPERPRRLWVDESPCIAFAAGHEVGRLRSPAGVEYVKVEEAVAGTPLPLFPVGGLLRSLRLDAEWVIDLPDPTETYGLDGAASFQGPLEGAPG